MIRSNSPWHAADLVALDLEGSGAQDRDREAILEIAVVSLAAGRPLLPDAYTTLVNPGRPIVMHPWISPGLTNQALRAAPPISDVEPELARRMTGRILVGHNVGVDWRLLHCRCPSIAPAGLVDTLRLARTLEQTAARSLTHLVERFNLADQVNVAAPGSTPHRALWDTVAVALLLEHLVRRRWAQPPTLAQLLGVAAPPVGDAVSVDHDEVTLF
jgi:DNA polymerase-3 subunit epsilon